jgi:transcriptional regulator with GAF, ATPase, and Fis domain
MVGMESEGFVVGKHSGKAGLQHFFEREGIHISEPECLKILGKIKEVCKKKKSLSLQEIRQRAGYPQLSSPPPFKQERKPKQSLSFDAAIKNFEMELIIDALKNSGGNMAEAARLLKTSERVVSYSVRKLRINPRAYRP